MLKNKFISITLFLGVLLGIGAFSCQQKTAQQNFHTVCNPIDVSYRFQPFGVSRREAADPTMIYYKGNYWLFASKSGGYWYSPDMKEWTFVKTNEIPTEDYAPTAIVMRDTVFFLASNPKSKLTVYKTTTPEMGNWDIACDSMDITGMIDPAFFQDDNGRLYFYWGCSSTKPIFGVELNPNTFKNIGEVQGFFHSDTAKHGWEVRGDYNRAFDEWIFVEGPWMNKFNGKYYLQYAVPGTAQKSYADGVYIADGPMGPFTLADHNPFAYKPEGFACGAGHGSTFYDTHGNLWHVGTVPVSIKHKFERRLALYPAFIDGDGILYSDTRYGDYPMIIADKKIKSVTDIFPGWMLLSYNKPVEVSSQLKGYPAQNMVDEEIRSYWSAETGSINEWAMVDLLEASDIFAIQVNFSEHMTYLKGRKKGLKIQYIVDVSNDKECWQTIVDKSNSTEDNSHDFTQLPQKVTARYMRIRNIALPDGHVALCGLRVFGKGHGRVPSRISNLTAIRNQKDRRSVNLSWSKAKRATGYMVNFGITKEKLYQSYMVYDTCGVQINVLNTYHDYNYTVEAFNENGITKSEIIINDK